MRRLFYHLTKLDREVIAEGIASGTALKDIATTLGKDPTSLSREVRTYRTEEGRNIIRRTNICKYAKTCQVKGLCRKTCPKRCATCLHQHCFDTCPDFVEEICPRTVRWPYVCNGCAQKNSCGFVRYSYYPSVADALANKIKRESRRGIILGKEELCHLDEIVTPLLKDKKHSPEVIVANNPDIAISAPTLRRYIDQGKCQSIRLDLLSAPARVPRKKRTVHTSKHTADGRSYADFIREAEPFKDLIWELDSVHGCQHDKSCLLTLMHRKSLTLFIFKLRACLSECVVSVFDYLEMLCEGAGLAFREVFSVILTDNGPEFSAADLLEASQFGEEKRCLLYYCDPYCSSQKPYIEGRHTLIRRVVPKGKSFDRLTHDKVALLASHINSYPSVARGGKCAFDLVDSPAWQRIFVELGFQKIAPNEVNLTRSLLKHL